VDAVEADQTFITAAITSIDSDIAKFREPDEEEKKAKSLHDRWKSALQRPVFFESFLSMFERNVDDWQRSLSRDEVESSLKDNAENQKRDNANRSSKRKSILDWWTRDIMSIVKLFLFIALPAELIFSFPIFFALSGGDHVIAIAGATVFTLGLFSTGQLTGKLILRSQARRVVAEGQGERISTKIRPIAFAGGVLVVFVGVSGVFVGAAMRQNAGEVLRLSDELQVEQQRQRILERSLTTALQADDSQQIQIIERQIDTSTDLQEQLTRERQQKVAATDSPFNTSEGRLSLFVFGIFFLSAAASVVMRHDPVYEYSQSRDNLIELEETRQSKLLIVQLARGSFEALDHQMGKTVTKVKSDIKEIEKKTDIANVQSENAKTIAKLEREVKSYAKLRALGLATTLARFGKLEPSEIDAEIEALVS